MLFVFSNMAEGLVDLFLDTCVYDFKKPRCYPGQHTPAAQPTVTEWEVAGGDKRRRRKTVVKCIRCDRVLSSNFELLSAPKASFD